MPGKGISCNFDDDSCGWNNAPDTDSSWFIGGEPLNEYSPQYDHTQTTGKTILYLVNDINLK